MFQIEQPDCVRIPGSPAELAFPLARLLSKFGYRADEQGQES